jgi:ankyrin repeat protein
MWKAAREGDVDAVERLLAQAPELLDAKVLGLTPLIWAAVGGHLGLVRWLVDHGAGIHETCGGDATALYYACGRGRSSLVRLLLDEGADPTVAAERTSTPLMIASLGGHLETVRVLLGHLEVKTTINRCCDDGKTALWLACSRCHGGVVKALLESGANPTIADSRGITPIAIANQECDLDAALAEGCRECVAALEVISTSPASAFHPTAEASVLSWRGGRRPSGPTRCGRPDKWPTSRGPTRWR